MLHKLIKTTLKTGFLYFIFIFFALFLSLFSYIFADSLVMSVRDFITENTKPFVGGDIVVSSTLPLDNEYIQKNYATDFSIGYTISTHTAIDHPLQDGKTQLIELIYYENYPTYNHVVFETDDPKGIFVSPEIQNIYGDTIRIFERDFPITGLVTIPAV